MHGEAVVLRRQFLLRLHSRLRFKHLQNRLVTIGVQDLRFIHQAMRVLQQKKPIFVNYASL